jgi:uncharacterized protein DUF2760
MGVFCRFQQKNHSGCRAIFCCGLKINMNNTLSYDLAAIPFIHYLPAVIIILLLVVIARLLRSINKKIVTNNVSETPHETTGAEFLDLLQKKARFLDFINEEITGFSDAEIGAAARVVHDGCSKVIKEHFAVETIRQEQKNSHL